MQCYSEFFLCRMMRLDQDKSDLHPLGGGQQIEADREPKGVIV